jgi:hypothetical protein
MKKARWKLLLAGLALLGGISLDQNIISANTTIRVGTYNLRAPKKNDTNKQKDLLENDQVEIAGTQEINYKNHRFSGKSKYNTLTNFKDDYFKNIFYSNAIDFAGGGYGIATVSALPLKDSKTVKLYSSEAGKHLQKLKKAYREYNPDKKSTVKNLDKLTAKYGKKLVEPRVYQRSVIEKDGKKIAFYNTHLSYESTKIRQKQFKALAKAMRKDKTPYKVLVGDFNADQNTTEWKTFKKNFNITNGKDGIWRDTFIGEDPTMNVNSIDNIITSKNISISNIHTIKSTASDHVPLVADLTLK